MSAYVRSVFRTGKVQYSPGATLGPRDTIEYEFVRHLKGDPEWTYDGKTYQLKAGDVTLSQPHKRESFQWDKHRETHHDFAHFTLAELPANFPDPSLWPVTSHPDAGNILHGLFDYLQGLVMLDNPHREYLMRGVIEQMLFCWVYETGNIRNDLSYYSDPVQAVFDAVHERWNTDEFRPPSVEWVCQVAGLSRSHLMREFRRECNDTPTHYFEMLRLRLATAHLLNTNESIETVAATLGYNTAFHFSKNFKQHMGCAPTHYREEVSQRQGTRPLPDYRSHLVYLWLTRDMPLY